MKCLKCGKEFKTLVIIDGKRRNLCCRKYCLICSPFGQKNKRKLHEEEVQEAIKKHGNGFKKCSRCEKDFIFEEFYVKKSGQMFPYCKICWSIITRENGIKRKKEAIVYKGGKCCKCDYDKYHGALEFHHRDMKEKEFNISRRWSFNKLKKELDKCDLVCSNCHREIHRDLY